MKFVGCYAAFVIVVLISISVLQFIEIPRAGDQERRDTGRPVIEIARQPKFIVAVMSSMIGYGVMALVMTGTPLAMVACGHKFNDTAFVIQWHMLGMFAPSFIHGEPARPLWRDENHHGGRCLDGGVHLHGTIGDFRRSILGRTSVSGARLEIHVHRRHNASDRDLPSSGPRQYPGIAQFPGLFDRRGERLFIRSDSAHAGLEVGQYRHDTADVPGGNRANLAAFRDQTANRDLLKG